MEQNVWGYLCQLCGLETRAVCTPLAVAARHIQ